MQASAPSLATAAADTRCILTPALSPSVSRTSNRRRDRAVDPGSISAGEREVRAGLSTCLTRLWRYGVLLSRRRDVADDLVQATFVRALERANQFQAGTQLDRWLFAILHSIWLNEVRSRRVRTGQGQVDADRVLMVDGGRQTEAHVLANQILLLADRLPLAQKTALWLAYVEGLSYGEIAEVTQVPIGTVMSRLAAARARITDSTVLDPARDGVPSLYFTPLQRA
ncbi:RNA polymerase sigma factor [Pseudorhodoplanes sinuspersici]|uniref:RNA polymerase subunit sigma-24 n=1 Tax=Pseudorhodoplanes sinuspersici TaxID=1235591 RepID=A0A1W6ZT57_9HYPH|nr:RNA polymerase subunit sigma-24 [Pseudorhodoplanes sinuspersici]RKE67543.1 RNA polymerase sigma-70 factor (ECF subfamily) [Pseudorhodoplanes sinuspersici]